MATSEPPITRSELREELREALGDYATKNDLREVLQHYATKEDLRRTIQNFATKEDLLQALQNYATKEDLRDTLRNYATKGDLASLETRLIKWMVGVMIGGMATAATITIAIQQAFG